jgi:hypothetical protein
VSIKMGYVIGPFRAPTMHSVLMNIRAAEAVGKMIFEAGAFPVIPHANTATFHGLGEDDFWLDGTLELMRRTADFAVTVDGWERSSGSRGEVREMEEVLRRPVFRSRGDDRRAEVSYFLDVGVPAPATPDAVVAKILSRHSSGETPKDLACWMLNSWTWKQAAAVEDWLIPGTSGRLSDGVVVFGLGYFQELASRVLGRIAAIRASRKSPDNMRGLPMGMVMSEIEKLKISGG